MFQYLPEQYRVVSRLGVFNVTRPEKTILDILTGARGNVVPSSRLKDALDDRSQYGDNVRGVMKRLRKKGVDVRAVYGVGYALASLPECLPELRPPLAGEVDLPAVLLMAGG